MAWFTEADLEDLAGERSFGRGLGYVNAVTNLRDLPNGVVATVRGGDVYEVRLYNRDGGLDGECSCPYGEDGNFCKHCVATGLRLLGRERATGTVHTGGGAGGVDVRTFIATLGHDELVDLVWSHASEDPDLYQRLLLRAIANADTVDLGLLEEQVERLHVDWLDYGEEQAYADRADAVVEALSDLVPDYAEDALPLLRRALCLINQAAGRSEDHCGAAGASAGAAWDAFLSACDAAPPDPVELGEWFAEFRLVESGGADVSISDIGDLLGSEGLDAYWEALERARAAKPSDHTVRDLREELIQATGDIDALVACYSEDLSGPHQYLRIAELLVGEDRTAEAIEWLERGRAEAGPLSSRSTRIVDLLIKLHAEAGRTEDVLTLHWERFRAEGTVAAYQVMRDAMVEADPERWPDRRAQALALLRSRTADQHAWGAGDVYVRVLLLEDEDEAAWEAMGTVRCDAAVRRAVADRRSATHPADALGVYLPMIESVVANGGDYDKAADLLVTLRGVFARAGRDFEAEVTRLKATYSRKRNFMAALRQRGL